MINFINEHQSEQQSEHLNEHLEGASIAEANTTNGKTGARVCIDILSLMRVFYFLRAHIKNSVRCVRLQCLKGFVVFVQVFALLFAFKKGVRALENAFICGSVA